MSVILGMLLIYKINGRSKKMMDKVKNTTLKKISDVIRRNILNLTIRTYSGKQFLVITVEFTDVEYLLRSKRRINETFLQICKTTVPYYATIAALDFANFNSKFFNDLLQRKIPRYADAPESDKLIDKIIDINIAFLHKDFFKKEPDPRLLKPIHVEQINDHYLIRIKEEEIEKVKCPTIECIKQQLEYLSKIIK